MFLLKLFFTRTVRKLLNIMAIRIRIRRSNFRNWPGPEVETGWRGSKRGIQSYLFPAVLSPTPLVSGNSYQSPKRVRKEIFS